MNKYDAKELLNSIIKYLEKSVVDNNFSIDHFEKEGFTLNLLDCKYFRVELNKFKNCLIFSDFLNSTEVAVLDAYGIVNFFESRLGYRTGKEFLIYLKCELI